MDDARPTDKNRPDIERTGRDLRDQVPVLGYRNYWYPAVESKVVKNLPIRLKILGDAVVLFRDSRTNSIHILPDRCPHRGSSLSHGKLYYPGTLTCRYHGWTFDGGGKLVAVLSEGPECPLVGTVKLKVYPAEEFRGFIWVWMGEGAPVPFVDDLPPEFRDPTTEIFTTIEDWNTNWRLVTENTDGYHAPILHRRSLPRTLYMDWVAWRKTDYIETEDGLGVVYLSLTGEPTAEFPGLGTWPQPTWWERAAKKFFGARIAIGTPIKLPDGRQAWITEDVHLPGWRRVRVRIHTVFLEWAVPIDENTTRHFMWDVIETKQAKTPRQKALMRFRVWRFRHIVFPYWWRWAYNRCYVGQDRALLEGIVHGPEWLQANDKGMLAWRRLAPRARGATKEKSA